MAFDSFQSQGPAVAISLFPQSMNSGIEGGNAQKSYTQAAIDGAIKGVQTGQEIVHNQEANQALAAQNEVNTDPDVIAAKRRQEVDQAEEHDQLNQLRQLQIQQAQAVQNNAITNKQAELENSTQKLNENTDDIQSKKTLEDAVKSGNEDQINTALNDPKLRSWAIANANEAAAIFGGARLNDTQKQVAQNMVETGQNLKYQEFLKKSAVKGLPETLKTMQDQFSEKVPANIQAYVAGKDGNPYEYASQLEYYPSGTKVFDKEGRKIASPEITIDEKVNYDVYDPRTEQHTPIGSISALEAKGLAINKTNFNQFNTAAKQVSGIQNTSIFPSFVPEKKTIAADSVSTPATPSAASSTPVAGPGQPAPGELNGFANNSPTGNLGPAPTSAPAPEQPRQFGEGSAAIGTPEAQAAKDTQVAQTLDAINNGNLKPQLYNKEQLTNRAARVQGQLQNKYNPNPPKQIIPQLGKETSMATPKATETPTHVLYNLLDKINPFGATTAQAEENLKPSFTFGDVKVPQLKEGTINAVNTNQYLQNTSPLVKGVALIESGGNQNAVSPTGVTGLLQVTKATAAAWGLNRDIPEENVLAGQLTLAQNLTMFQGNVPLALAAYNAGPGIIKQAVQAAGSMEWGAVKAALKDFLSPQKYKETASYPEKVMTASLYFTGQNDEHDKTLLNQYKNSGVITFA